MAHLKVKFRHVKALDAYHMYIWADDKWHFLFNFPPCDNIEDFVEQLNKEDITILCTG